MLMRAVTVVQVLQDLFYVLLHVLFFLWSLLNAIGRQRLSGVLQEWGWSMQPPDLDGLSQRWMTKGSSRLQVSMCYYSLSVCQLDQLAPGGGSLRFRMQARWLTESHCKLIAQLITLFSRTLWRHRRCTGVRIIAGSPVLVDAVV